ncbi:hypothetical protein AB9K41_28220, partial [Cribrihabitans sp. XS_ASV171]
MTTASYTTSVDVTKMVIIAIGLLEVEVPLPKKIDHPPVTGSEGNNYCRGRFGTDLPTIQPFLFRFDKLPSGSADRILAHGSKPKAICSIVSTGVAPVLFFRSEPKWLRIIPQENPTPAQLELGRRCFHVPKLGM